MARQPLESHEAHRTYRTARDDRRAAGAVTVAKWTCWVLGVVFLLLAVFGFVGYGMVLGAFAVSPLHSWLHLLSGVVLFGVGFADERTARIACWVFAAIYAVIMIFGFAGVDWLIQALNLNVADNWLYLVMTVIFVAGAGTSHAQEHARLQTAAPAPGIRRPSGR